MLRNSSDVLYDPIGYKPLPVSKVLFFVNFRHLIVKKSRAHEFAFNSWLWYFCVLNLKLLSLRCAFFGCFLWYLEILLQVPVSFQAQQCSFYYLFNCYIFSFVEISIKNHKHIYPRNAWTCSSCLDFHASPGEGPRPDIQHFCLSKISLSRGIWFWDISRQTSGKLRNNFCAQRRT